MSFLLSRLHSLLLVCMMLSLCSSQRITPISQLQPEEAAVTVLQWKSSVSSAQSDSLRLLHVSDEKRYIFVVNDTHLIGFHVKDGSVLFSVNALQSAGANTFLSSLVGVTNSSVVLAFQKQTDLLFIGYSPLNGKKQWTTAVNKQGGWSGSCLSPKSYNGYAYPQSPSTTSSLEYLPFQCGRFAGLLNITDATAATVTNLLVFPSAMLRATMNSLGHVFVFLLSRSTASIVAYSIYLANPATQPLWANVLSNPMNSIGAHSSDTLVLFNMLTVKETMTYYNFAVFSARNGSKLWQSSESSQRQPDSFKLSDCCLSVVDVDLQRHNLTITTYQAYSGSILWGISQFNSSETLIARTQQEGIIVSDPDQFSYFSPSASASLLTPREIWAYKKPDNLNMIVIAAHENSPHITYVLTYHQLFAFYICIHPSQHCPWTEKGGDSEKDAMKSTVAAIIGLCLGILGLVAYFFYLERKYPGAHRGPSRHSLSEASSGNAYLDDIRGTLE